MCMNTFKIILKEKEFEISSNFRYFNDIDPDICKQLLTTKQYILKSDVQEETLHSFINFWINKEIPNFTPNNIFEYDLLSQEFDLMKEVILIYKRSLHQIQIKENQIQQLDLKIEKNSITYQKIFDILLKKQLNCLFKDKLFNAIQDENIEKVKFYCQPTFSNEYFLFILNEDDKTAGILLSLKQTKILNIPMSIGTYYENYDITVIHEDAFKNQLGIEILNFPFNSRLNIIDDNAFTSSSIQKITIPKSVTKIGKRAFAYCHDLKTVNFEPNSKLNYIGESAFEGSKIKSLTIPSNNIEFKENWCFWVRDLTHLDVSPNFKQNCISLYNNQFLLMKSDPKSDVFDILLLAVRNIEKAVIPPFVRKISELAFANCTNLQTVEFSADSEIKIIGKNAFHESSIKNMIIPSSVEKFEDEWCSETNNFTNFVILQNEKENITCYQDKLIFGKTDLTSKNFDILYFACRDIANAHIPSFIKIIGSNAFDSSNIQNITFSEDSQLISIENYAFQYSNLSNISIPCGITKINKNTFYECYDLEQFEIPINSELTEFEDSSLFGVGIEKLYIPSKISKFNSEWCDNILYLNEIIISPQNENFIYLENSLLVGKSDPTNLNYDVLIFARRDIQVPRIPSFIKRIAPCAFNHCSKLETVIFTRDSKLEIIEEDAFSCSSLRRIKIPAGVKEIKYSGFDECDNLKIVEFEENCQLRSIETFAFHNVPITSLVFPPHLRKIDNEVFHWTEMQIIEISEDSEMCTFSFSIFVAKYPDLVMVPSKIRKDFKFY